MIDVDEFNYYGDESCYLQSDDSQFMVLGIIRCPKYLSKKISKDIKEIKIAHNLKPNFEIKSTKVSKGKEEFYKDLVNYFLNEKKLDFRAIIVDKTILNHEKFHQTHDDFYYKMYYDLIKYFLKTGSNCIYLDYKDSQSYKKSQVLSEILSTKLRLCDLNVKVQPINSSESNILQLADLLIGLTCYNARELHSNSTKLELIQIIKDNLNIDMVNTNFIDKFNILKWRPKSNA